MEKVDWKDGGVLKGKKVVCTHHRKGMMGGCPLAPSWNRKPWNTNVPQDCDFEQNGDLEDCCEHLEEV